MAIGDTPPGIAGPLKRYPEDLVQYEYLDKFILDLEKDPEVREAPAKTVD